MKQMIKTKKQLVDEITELRRKIKAFETALSKSPEKNQELRPSEELFRLLVEHANEAILVIQKEKIRYVNKKAAEITGYSKNELHSRSLIDFIHPDDRKLISLDETHHRQGETEPKPLTCCIIDRRRNARWVDARLLGTKWAGENATLCFLTDITERKAAEEALRISETKYRQLVEYAPAGIYEVDMTTGGFLSVNDVMCEYTGYSKEEFLNFTLWDILKEDSLKKVIERVEKMRRGEAVPALAEYEVVTKDNRKLWIMINTKLEYKNGKPVKATTVCHNITEKKELEQEILKAQKLESLGVLAGGIGHDFNNLLSGIIGNISLAKLEAERGEDIMESLDEALRVSSKASALTQQLLVFSKGGAPIKKAASIAEVLRDSTAFTLRGSKVKCKFKIDNELWPVKVDVGQFSQVIHNLVINAMQAMSRGGEMKLEAKNVSLDTIYDMPLIPGRYVDIMIQDQGNGIAQEYLSKIFDPYFTTKSKGTGLGLTMSYTTIKRHDGHITVESEMGKGTTFHIYLPATEEVPEEKTDKQNRTIAGEGRILVMDDEEILRKVAERMLLEIGYEVECVRDGSEALERYEKDRRSGRAFDAVIMDLTIPGGMGGKETIKKLLKIDPKAIVVVSSGYSNDPIMSNYEKFGFHGVVTKPYRIEQLSWVMRDVLTAGKKRK
jgi:two-component system cell cycle sensor histidine kinase/response regulator CckA